MAKMPRASNNASRFAAFAAASLCAALALAPAASGAGDPVANGHFELALSTAFKKQLKEKSASVKARGLSVEAGSVDPVTGAGSLNLGGTVKFKYRRKRVVFGNLEVTLGPNGRLKGSVLRRGGTPKRGATTLFRLSGGSVIREGFGARISGLQASFARRGAKKLRRKLGVRLPRRTAGSLAVYIQPETVEVLGGTATVSQDLSPGGIADKLRAHCIDPVAGVSPTGAATQPGGPGTPFLVPVSGGTISPTGWTAGVVDLAGGLDVEVGGPGLPGGCPTSSVATIHFAKLAVNVAHESVKLELSASGPASPFPGMVLPLELQGNTDSATMLADPATHTLTASGVVLGVDHSAAWAMNTFLPHPSGGPSTQFQVGDLFGSAGMTVQVR
ncbi:MAG: hypothetical protein ACRDKV_06825 [Solirubrobacterales bacterium]